MRTVTDEIVAVISDPNTSPWLREALRSALHRDPVDAASDAQQLGQLLTDQVETLLFLEEWRWLCPVETRPVLDLTEPSRV